MFFTIWTLTSPIQLVSANDNVLDCIENPEKCEETGPLNPGIDVEENEQKSAVGVTAWDYARTIFALVFVVSLLFFLLKFINRRNRMYDKNKLMKNMGGLSLGQHKSVQLINVGNTYYLIGVGEEIRLLKEITDEEEISTLIEYYEEVDGNESTGLLNQLLVKIMSRKTGKTNRTNDGSQDFSNIFNSRLDEVKEERKRRLRQMTEKERDQDD